MSLDGFIADDDGGYDWITDEPAIDFDAYLAKIDTLLMGRGSWELVEGPDGDWMFEGRTVYVVSTTLTPAADSRVTVIGSDVAGAVAALKGKEGGDIWLFGGGVLFRSLLQAEVITASVAVHYLPGPPPRGPTLVMG